MSLYSFTRRSRGARTLAILAVLWAGLLALVILFDAVWWLVGLLALTTLPAIWDVLRNHSAGLSLDRQELRWHSGKRHGELNAEDIAYFRFDTRWDFSVRVSVVLNSDKRIRLPDEAIPPHRVFEIALRDSGYRVERHHFTVF